MRCRIRIFVLYLYIFDNAYRASAIKASNVMQSQVGRGEQSYAQAKELLDSWKQLELEWSTCALPVIQDGTVQTKVYHFTGYIAVALAQPTECVPSLYTTQAWAPGCIGSEASACGVAVCVCRRVLKQC